MSISRPKKLKNKTLVNLIVDTTKKKDVHQVNEGENAKRVIQYIFKF